MLRILEFTDPEVGQLRDREFSFPEGAVQTVNRILARVRAEGDNALCALAAEFDRTELLPEELVVREEEIALAYEVVEPGFLAAVRLARDRIFSFHSKKLPGSWQETLPGGEVLGQLVRPLACVGVYVPGGRARYPSSVLMNVVPARAAGVIRVVMATPPGPGGKIAPHVLVAASEAGVDEIYRAGGAQAIAAMAFGTERIPRVDKIVGPGNIYVTLAKRAVFGVVGIDILAGPSEVVVVADEMANPCYVAADVLAQAEHDPQALVLLVTPSREFALQVNAVLRSEFVLLGEPVTVAQAMAQSRTVIVPDIDTAVAFANEVAPEHLELMVAEPFAWLEKVQNAGAVFLGPYSPVPMGDYIAGPNHVLPTGGTARFFSPLGVEDFIKRTNVVAFSRESFEKLATSAALMASVEGLPAHRRAIMVREENEA